MPLLAVGSVSLSAWVNILAPSNQKVLYVYTYSAKMKILFIYQSVLILRRKVIKMISTLASKLAAVEPNCQLDLKLNAGIL